MYIFISQKEKLSKITLNCMDNLLWIYILSDQCSIIYHHGTAVIALCIKQLPSNETVEDTGCL
jgi:hypothetical protein